MRTFNEFIQSKESGSMNEQFVQIDQNLDRFCETVLENADQIDWSNPEVLSELFAGLGGLARSAMSGIRTGVGAAAGAVKRGAQGIADRYQTAEHQAKIKKVMAKVDELKQTLDGLGIRGRGVDNNFAMFTNKLNAQLQGLEADRGMRTSDQGLVRVR